ncbi:MAG TPA: 3-methyl-2-oxobutanoate hydroxymethyltransferase [Bacillus sp. (in: firmicutes)]|uniref:3-methyl-2-oxobutanoate hydroxymethyltransferase n=1 Tax=Bacillus litorisediminis TaxID=2922713 RepID=UPI001FAD94D5|nr:3-methyl-2-oxobutanoate hydroxymethyltransferase [Bacillus litorisediminis]HWO76371.1 3-methyl-2-oxobutanoate hydroxymethyltransferase [Bacillus sp. (in: firmicutes)]
MKSTTDFLKMKKNGEKIVMMTAYDYPSAKLSEAAGLDIILVGDSLGMVVLGYESTVPVTLADMIHHTKAVKRGAPDTFIVADMPFMTYHQSMDQTLSNAGKLFQETGCHALKLEGGGDVIPKIKAMTEAGIPVVAHLGLTPQSAGVLGGYKVQGKTKEAAEKLIEDARLCEAAGAFAVVLECIPYQLAETISKQLTIPTIGIGAGPHTDGQVLVFHDLIQFGIDRTAKFVKTYNNLNQSIKDNIEAYIHDVKSGSFPELKHSYTMKEEELTALYGGTK